MRRGSHPHRSSLSETAGESALDLICVHGQTVFHQPPVSWQLVNTAPITEAFECPVVSDLRQADLARGGQGAPITPMADLILFGDEARSRAIVNLGGYCNITLLPAGQRDSSVGMVRGFDVCACNHVLNAVARIAIGKPYDDGGKVAMSGNIDQSCGDALRALLQSQHKEGRSLGTGDDVDGWIQHASTMIGGETLLATAVYGVGACIGEVVRASGVHECIVAGGGAFNHALISRITESCGLPRASVRLSGELGVPVESRESIGFAVLGALCADGVPITLTQVTGCRAPAPLSGVWSGVGNAIATGASK